MVNTLYNYEGFDKDIKEAFQAIIEQYHLKFKRVGEGRYELSNGKCIIRFVYDRGDVGVLLKNPKDNEDEFGNDVAMIFKYLHPELDEYEGIEYNPRRQLIDEATKCTYLGNILNGDFTWMPGFLYELKKSTALIRYIKNELDLDNPIYLQFMADDPSWFENIEQYIKINNIDISGYM
ncbi:MAG TPA: hypothetical protein VHA56_12660 [Mucilaginibacter sp.]|nr:hypothetical protein [Mucilaginibacter sp.]